MFNFRLIRHLYLFTIVAQEGSIGRAAERLGMSQPPLTEHIKTLESNLGTVLFHRSKSGVQLTSTGQRILPKAQLFVQQMMTLQQEIDDVLKGVNHTIRVGAITQSMTQMLPRLMDEFDKRYPDTKIIIQEINSAGATALLADGHIDVALVRAPLDGHQAVGIRSIPIKNDTLCAVLPKSHPLAKADTLKLSTLAQESFVMHKRSVSPKSFDEVIGACKSVGFEPKIYAETTSAVAQIAMVSCSELVALVPESLANFAGDSGFIPLTDDDGKPIIITAIVLLSRQDDDAVQAFCQMVIDGRQGD